MRHVPRSSIGRSPAGSAASPVLSSSVAASAPMPEPDAASEETCVAFSLDPCIAAPAEAWPDGSSVALHASPWVFWPAVAFAAANNPQVQGITIVQFDKYLSVKPTRS
jgi:hypothetical protein